MILFVCTGNICRSPFAEGMLRKRLRERGQAVPVLSAGVGAPEGASSPPALIEIASLYGVDMRGHRSRPLHESLLDQARIVYVMDHLHREVIRERFPQYMGKIRMLGRYDADQGSEAIDDPLGLDQDLLSRCYQRIVRCIDRLLEDPESPLNDEPVAHAGG